MDIRKLIREAISGHSEIERRMDTILDEVKGPLSENQKTALSNYKSFLDSNIEHLLGMLKKANETVKYHAHTTESFSMGLSDLKTGAEPDGVELGVLEDFRKVDFHIRYSYTALWGEQWSKGENYWTEHYDVDYSGEKAYLTLEDLTELVEKGAAFTEEGIFGVSREAMEACARGLWS
jgi:nucleoid DNA-binding protein